MEENTEVIKAYVVGSASGERKKTEFEMTLGELTRRGAADYPQRIVSLIIIEYKSRKSRAARDFCYNSIVFHKNVTIC